MARDLFDLAVALEQKSANPDRNVEAFQKYMEHGRHAISRAQFEENFHAKLNDDQFAADFVLHLENAADVVKSNLIERLPGEPWKGMPAD